MNRLRVLVGLMTVFILTIQCNNDEKQKELLANETIKKPRL